MSVFSTIAMRARRGGMLVFFFFFFFCFKDVRVLERGLTGKGSG